MQNFGFVGPAGQFFKLLDAKTKRAQEAARELKEMQFERMITKGQDDPYDLAYLHNEPVAKIKPCHLMPTIPCDVPVSCDQCSVYWDFKNSRGL